LNEDIDTLPTIPPHQMTPSFTKDEISKAVKLLKKNKSAGGDDLKAEQQKCGPDIVFESIEEIFNTISTTGESSTKIKDGILIPIQKSGKAQRPASNLGTIILLSMLHKVQATCMLWRIREKIHSKRPVTRKEPTGLAEVQQSSSEEKVVRSTNFETHVLTMDVSKAFDIVNRKILLENLRSILDFILDSVELHNMIKVLIDVRL